MLVGSNQGALDRLHVPVDLAVGVGLGLHCREQPLPDPSVLPAVKTTGDRAPGAIAFGQIAPGSAGASNPEHTIQDAAMINRRSAGLGFLWRKQWVQPLPLRIG